MATVQSTKLAALAYERVAAITKDNAPKYLSFARSFPTLIHTCGLVQASAFALAKRGEHGLVLNDLAYVMTGDKAVTGDTLQSKIRDTDDLANYQSLTRRALVCATWIKRYAEAVHGLTEDKPPAPSKDN